MHLCNAHLVQATGKDVQAVARACHAPPQGLVPLARLPELLHTSALLKVLQAVHASLGSAPWPELCHLDVHLLCLTALCINPGDAA